MSLNEVFVLEEGVVRRFDVGELFQWWTEVEEGLPPAFDTIEDEIRDFLSNAAESGLRSLSDLGDQDEPDQQASLSADQLDADQLAALEYIATEAVKPDEGMSVDGPKPPIQSNRARMIADWAKSARRGKPSKLDSLG